MKALEIKLNSSKILFAIVGIGIVVAALVFAYFYCSSHNLFKAY